MLILKTRKNRVRSQFKVNDNNIFIIIIIIMIIITISITPFFFLLGLTQPKGSPPITTRGLC
jgi:hypothetical protein